MKKIITILGITSLMGVTATSLVACAGGSKEILNLNVDIWKSNYGFQNYNAINAIAFNSSNFNLSGHGMFINKSGNQLSSYGLTDAYDSLKPSKKPWENGDTDFTPGFAMLDKVGESMIYYHEKTSKNNDNSFLHNLTGNDALKKIDDNFEITYKTTSEGEVADAAIAKVFNSKEDIRYCATSIGYCETGKDSTIDLSGSDNIYDGGKDGVNFYPAIQWQYTQGGQGSVASSAVIYFTWILKLKTNGKKIIDEVEYNITESGFYSKSKSDSVEFNVGYQIGLSI